jgi:hypothetical protein
MMDAPSSMRKTQISFSILWRIYAILRSLLVSKTLNFHHMEANSTPGCGSRFTDIAKGMDIMVGYDNLIFGSKIETSGGSSGILPSDARLETAGTLEDKEVVEVIAKAEVE